MPSNLSLSTPLDTPPSYQSIGVSRGSIARSLRDLSMLTIGLASLDLGVLPFQAVNLVYKGGKLAVQTAATLRRPEFPGRNSTGSRRGTILFDRLRHRHEEVMEAYEQVCRVARTVETTALELQLIYDDSEELANDDPRLLERKARITDLISKRNIELSGLRTPGDIFDIPRLTDTSLGKSVMSEGNDQHFNKLVLACTEAFLSHEFALKSTIQSRTEKGYREGISNEAGSSKTYASPTLQYTSALDKGTESDATSMCS